MPPVGLVLFSLKYSNAYSKLLSKRLLLLQMTPEPFRLAMTVYFH
jgi:hypothetical protein